MFQFIILIFNYLFKIKQLWIISFLLIYSTYKFNVCFSIDYLAKFVFIKELFELIANFFIFYQF